MASSAGKRGSTPPGHFGDMQVDWEEDDDYAWVPSVPGRPGPYANTWNLVYAKRKINLTTGVISIGCLEGCGKAIVMNGKSQESLGWAFQKPPVCHIVPWVAIKHGIGALTPPGKTALDPFQKWACWGNINNLRPGHTACNGGGTKTTGSNMSAYEQSQGIAIVNNAILTWTGAWYY